MLFFSVAYIWDMQIYVTQFKKIENKNLISRLGSGFGPENNCIFFFNGSDSKDTIWVKLP